MDQASSDGYPRWRQLVTDAQRALRPSPWAARLAGWLPGATDVRVDRHEIVIPELRAERPLRIAFASDFHAGPITPPHLLDLAVDRLIGARADLVLLGGDFVSLRAADAALLVQRLATVPAPLGRYAVLGNHDHDSDGTAMTALLEAAGITVLTNRSVRLPAPFAGISVCGLDDHTMGAPDAGAAFAGAAPLRIVLMHAPSGLLDIGVHPFTVALCGHTHGGQLALPNGWPVLTACGPLSRRYSAGRYALAGGRTLLVSCGVGYTALPIRLNAPPSITLCTIEPAQDVSSRPASSSATDRATR
ncbi:MAG: metallophosphoesterase [Vicinamibacteraceae bacterium]